MFVVTVNFVSKPEFTEQFAHRVQQQARDSLNRETECHQFDVCQDDSDPTKIFLYEIYTDADAFQAHLDSQHFKAFDAECRDWVAEKTVATYQRIQNAS